MGRRQKRNMERSTVVVVAGLCVYSRPRPCQGTVRMNSDFGYIPS